SADIDDQTAFSDILRATMCPVCGLAHASSSKFCRACGHALRNTAPWLPSIAAPVSPSGPSGSFPLAAYAPPTVQPQKPTQAPVKSELRALAIALSVTLGLPVALLVFWIGGA